MLYSRSSYLSLPSKPGVYQFLNDSGQIIYVGKAINLKNRVSSYFTDKNLGEKTRLLVEEIRQIKITIVESELEALLLEAYYIKKFKPRYNIKLTDNKAYVLVRITNQKRSRNYNYPSILLARRTDDPSSVYFGPFPRSSAVRLVLKTIRRAFPFQSVENHPKRICLYNHLGLCPCPPMNDSAVLRREYQINIKNIIRIFQGSTNKIIKQMEKERDEQSKQEKFEEAAKLQSRISALSYITQPVHKPFEYEINPNLRTDLRTKETESLKQILNENGCKVSTLERIECYDISHTQGTNTTASMVVFTNGEKDSSQYRKFKVRKKWLETNGKENNDFASMQEVLGRRLNHNEWMKPGLIIVDGGKGQVSAALKILKDKANNIPLIGLAKREEIIVIPLDNGSEDISFKEVILPKDTQALQLLQRIRDEAHRFAITYHRKLRSRNVLSN